MDPSGYVPEHGLYQSPSPLGTLPHAGGGVTDFIFSGPVGDVANKSKHLLINGNETGVFLTCGEFRSHVSSVRAGLASLLGVSQGDVVLILLNNTIYFPVVVHAIFSLGAIASTANPANTRAEIERQVEDSGAKFVFTVPELLEKLGELNRFAGVVLLENKSFRASNVVAFNRLLRFEDSDFSSTVSIHADDPAALLYSSGTTGKSKGVILSHGNLTSAVEALRIAFNDESPSAIILLPMYHVAGLVVSACHLTRLAATTVVLEKFDMINMLDAIDRYRVRYIPLVPPIAVAMIKHPAVANYDLTSLKKASCGAAPLGKETLEAFRARFPHVEEFSQGYGMTETTCVGAYGPGPFGSCGRLAAGHQAKVVDVMTTQPLPPYSTGELWLRGPCIMQGYLNNPSATKQAIDPDGWLHTGDMVYFDSNGCLYVVDRLKELIKYKAYQVAPAELEALLLTHPDVTDAAVVPYPDEDAGEVPLAYIVTAPGKSVTEENIIEFIAKQVAPYKKVRKVKFLESIPKSPAGKILRKDLVTLARSKL